MADEFESYKTSLTAPARNAESVTPSDSTDLTRDSRALYVGGAGDVAVEMVSGDVVTLSSVPAGSLLSIMVRRVNSTNTTATDIVSLS